MSRAIRFADRLGATRPAFLSITLLAVVLGATIAWWQQASGNPLSASLLLITLFGALLAHAGANVLNDVADADNGSDAANVDRVAPFTGGSRFIQQGIISRQGMLRLAMLLFFSAVLCGLALLQLTDLRLMAFGLTGLLLALAYSLPPLKLMARGGGEIAVALAWLLIIAGSDFVLRRQIDGTAWLGGLPFALQIALILIVNQVPDLVADRQAGKRNWVVRLGASKAAQLYRGGLFASYGSLLLAWQLNALPPAALCAIFILPIGIVAARQIADFAPTPHRLVAPIRLTLLQAHLVGIVLPLSLIADHYFRIAP